MCQFCDLYIRTTGDPFSIVVDTKSNQPVPSSEEAPKDAIVFTFAYKAQAREWYHRKEWERRWFSNAQEELRLSTEEKQWLDFHADMRNKIDANKGDLERLLRSSTIKNVTHGLQAHGFKVTEAKEIVREGSSETFCGFAGGLQEGIDKATFLIAMFELYLEYAHVQEMKKEA